jgi:hypothetical protein
VGGRLPGRHDLLSFWRLLGCFGGVLAVGTVTGPMAALSARGRRASLAASTGRVMGLALASRMAATTAWPSAGFQPAGEPRKWPVQALGFLRSRNTVSSSRSSNTGTAVSGDKVATGRTRTRAGNASSFQIGVVSLNGSDTTSNTPIQRSMPVR